MLNEHTVQERQQLKRFFKARVEETIITFITTILPHLLHDTFCMAVNLRNKLPAETLSIFYANSLARYIKELETFSFQDFRPS